MSTGPPTSGNRWLEGSGRRGAAYDERFATLAAQGHDVHGEADLVESFGVRAVLDAGCGTGRVAIELAARGVDVVGADVDPAMLDAARVKRPDLVWVEGDLATLLLGRTFDAVVMAGNVMLFVAPGTEGAVLANLARHVEPGGWLVAGFSLRPGDLDLVTYDGLAADAGLTLADRWATWDRAPFVSGGDYAVSVHRLDGGALVVTD
ncbi:MAG TPA: class I SAM-dependent methyltransferase [Acidimicrobiales bacterium]|nr:class I SAM-dependent methyltransferase [Acidimicrobiales bacterium]